MSDSKCEKRMWAEAVNTAVYLINRSPSKRIPGKTPEELWTGEKMKLHHLRVFGCPPYARVPKDKRDKLEATSKLCIFVGYCEQSKAYRLIDYTDPSNVIYARDVIFLEDQSFSELKLKNQPSTELVDMNVKEGVPIEGNILPEMVVESEPSSENEEVLEDISSRRYPLRIRTPKQLQDFVVYNVATNEEDKCPVTVSEALSDERWKSAMCKEYQALVKNNVWRLVDKPKNKNIIPCKWVFTLKDTPGERLYKARLVAKGFSQIHGIDYDETYSPVVRYSTIRLLFALAVDMGLKVEHLDVPTAV